MKESIVEETQEKVEQPKKWQFRKLNALDIWLITPIIKKIGVNNIRKCFSGDIVKELVAEKVAGNENTDEQLNAALFGATFELLQIIVDGADKCQDDLFNLLEKTSNLSRKQIEELGIMELPLMIFDFIRNDDFREIAKNVDFSKVARLLAK